MNFKKFAIGLAIFILTIIFIVFANEAINQKPKSEDCYSKYNTYSTYDSPTDAGTTSPSYDDTLAQQCYKTYDASYKNYQEKSFVTILILSLLAIIAGVLVRSVAPVSWGLVLSGLVMIIYVFGANFEAIGKPYRAIATGISLAILIWLAYAKLGDKERINGQIPATKTPVPPVPPASPAPPVPPATPVN